MLKDQIVFEKGTDWKFYDLSMSLREYYAGLAMNAMIAGSEPTKKSLKNIATWAVIQADALIAELKKPTSHE